eukprot:TRINITY_DN294_c5_g1_i1.p1 TRINITY_DN294_c5_g1~~TRINITY_DN294_c5_g1_i1.p1  ORF type:complete len:245 (+),score=72.87 TRINITY_DN294_c5_g1_i1:119-853(+)
MSVALQVRLSAAETVAVEVSGSDTIEVLKEKVASLTGLEAGCFMLIFEGEELKGRVSEYPFEDQSAVVVGVSEKQKALMRLKEMGWGESDAQSLKEYLEVQQYDGHGEFTTLGDVKRESIDVLCTEVVKQMKAADLCKDRDVMGEVLAEAVYCGLSKLPDLLLTKGLADVDTQPQGWHGMTALHIAVSEELPHIAKLLLQHHADPNKRNNSAKTPLQLVAMTPSGLASSLAQLLLDHNADPIPY